MNWPTGGRAGATGVVDGLRPAVTTPWSEPIVSQQARSDTGDTQSGIAIDVRHLTKSYDEGVDVLTDVSFAVGPGERVVLLGPNGSGKSTLLRCLVCLERPSSGTVSVGDCEVTSASKAELRELRRQVGMVWQNFDLVGNSSVFTNVLHGALGRGGVRTWSAVTASRACRDQAFDCLSRVGLAQLASRRADTLSGGQQQRVSIARTLMQQPRLILADEPIASLDPKAATEVMDLLWSVASERGVGVICTLHQLDVARRYADRVIGLRAGRLVLDTPIAELREDKVTDLYLDPTDQPIATRSIDEEPRGQHA